MGAPVRSAFFSFWEAGCAYYRGASCVRWAPSGTRVGLDCSQLRRDPNFRRRNLGARSTKSSGRTPRMEILDYVIVPTWLVHEVVGGHTVFLIILHPTRSIITPTNHLIVDNWMSDSVCERQPLAIQHRK